MQTPEQRNEPGQHAGQSRTGYPALDTSQHAVQPLSDVERQQLTNAAEVVRDFCLQVLPDTVRLPDNLQLFQPHSTGECVTLVTDLTDHFLNSVQLLQFAPASDAVSASLTTATNALKIIQNFSERLQSGKRSDGLEYDGAASVYLMLDAIKNVSVDLSQSAPKVRAYLAASALNDEVNLKTLKRHASVASHNQKNVNNSIRTFASRSRAHVRETPVPGRLENFATALGQSTKLTFWTTLVGVNVASATLHLVEAISGFNIPALASLPIIVGAGIVCPLLLKKFANKKVQKQSQPRSSIGKEVPLVRGGSFRTRDTEISRTMPVQTVRFLKANNGTTADIARLPERMQSSSDETRILEHFSSLRSVPTITTTTLGSAETEVSFQMSQIHDFFYRPLDRSITALCFLDASGIELAAPADGYHIREFLQGGFQVEGKIPVAAAQVQYRWVPSTPVPIHAADIAAIHELMPAPSLTGGSSDFRFGVPCAALEGSVEQKVNSLIAKLHARGLYYSEDPNVGWLLDNSGDAYYDVLAAIGAGDCEALGHLAAAEIGAITPAFLIAGPMPRKEKTRTSAEEAIGTFDLSPGHMQVAYLTESGVKRVDLTTHTKGRSLNKNIFELEEWESIQKEFRDADAEQKTKIALDVRETLIERTKAGLGEPKKAEQGATGHTFRDDVQRKGNQEQVGAAALQYMNAIVQRLAAHPEPLNLVKAIEYYKDNEWRVLSSEERNQLPSHYKFLSDFDPATMILEHGRELLLNEKFTGKERELFQDFLVHCCTGGMQEVEMPAPTGILTVNMKNAALFDAEAVAHVMDAELCGVLSEAQLLALIDEIESEACHLGDRETFEVEDAHARNVIASDVAVMARGFANAVQELSARSAFLSGEEAGQRCGEVTASLFHVLSVVSLARSNLRSEHHPDILAPELQVLWKVSDPWVVRTEPGALASILISSAMKAASLDRHPFSTAVHLANEMNIASTFSDPTIVFLVQDVLESRTKDILSHCLTKDLNPAVVLAELEKLGLNVYITVEDIDFIAELMGQELDKLRGASQALQLPDDSLPATSLLMKGSKHLQAHFYQFAQSLDGYNHGSSGQSRTRLLERLSEAWPDDCLSDKDALRLLAGALQAVVSDSGHEVVLSIGGARLRAESSRILAYPVLASAVIGDNQAAQVALHYHSTRNDHSMPLNGYFEELAAKQPQTFVAIGQVLRQHIEMERSTKVSPLTLDLIHSLAASLPREELYRGLLWLAQKRVRDLPRSEAAQELIKKLDKGDDLNGGHRNSGFENGMDSLNALMGNKLPRLIEQLVAEGCPPDEVEERLSAALSEDMSHLLKRFGESSASDEVADGTETELVKLASQDESLSVAGPDSVSVMDDTAVIELDRVRKDKENVAQEFVRAMAALDPAAADYEKQVQQVLLDCFGSNITEPSYFLNLPAHAKVTALLIEQMLWSESESFPYRALADCLQIPVAQVKSLLSENFAPGGVLSREYFWSAIANQSVDDKPSPSQKGLVNAIPRLIAEWGHTAPTRVRTEDGSRAGTKKTSLSGLYDSFAGMREYAAGDSMAHINWKAWARTDRMLVNTYYDSQPEHSLIVTDLAWLSEGAENWQGGKLAPAMLREAPNLVALLQTLQSEERAGRKPQVVVGGRDGIVLQRTYKELRIDAHGAGVLHAEMFLTALVQHTEREGRLRNAEKDFLGNQPFSGFHPLQGDLPVVRRGTLILSGMSAAGVESSRGVMAQSERRAGLPTEYL